MLSVIVVVVNQLVAQTTNKLGTNGFDAESSRLEWLSRSRFVNNMAYLGKGAVLFSVFNAYLRLQF